MIPPKRRVVVPVDDLPVDKAMLKSLIRDEVNLQVERQMRKILKPLYQIILADPRFEDDIPDMPEWVQQLTEQDEPNDEEELPFYMRDDQSIWGL